MPPCQHLLPASPKPLGCRKHEQEVHATWRCHLSCSLARQVPACRSKHGQRLSWTSLPGQRSAFVTAERAKWAARGADQDLPAPGTYELVSLHLLAGGSSRVCTSACIGCHCTYLQQRQVGGHCAPPVSDWLSHDVLHIGTACMHCAMCFLQHSYAASLMWLCRRLCHCLISGGSVQ